MRCGRATRNLVAECILRDVEENATTSPKLKMSCEATSSSTSSGSEDIVMCLLTCQFLNVYVGISAHLERPSAASETIARRGKVVGESSLR